MLRAMSLCSVRTPPAGRIRRMFFLDRHNQPDGPRSRQYRTASMPAGSCPTPAMLCDPGVVLAALASVSRSSVWCGANGKRLNVSGGEYAGVTRWSVVATVHGVSSDQSGGGETTGPAVAYAVGENRSVVGGWRVHRVREALPSLPGAPRHWRLWRAAGRGGLVRLASRLDAIPDLTEPGVRR
jgi:hypothetical protein